MGGNLLVSGVGCFNSAVCTPLFLASGCIGIGMTAPASSLHIIRALGSDVINIGESGTGTRFAIGQEASYTGNYINSRNIDLKLQAFCAGGSGGNIHFQTGTDGTGCVTTKMFLCSTGNVGIGTLSPTDRLDIHGNDTIGAIVVRGGSSQTGRNVYLLSGGINAAGTLLGVTRCVNQFIYANNSRLTIGTADAHSLGFSTSDTLRTIIDSSGIACFACQVCARSLTIATDCSGVVVDVADRHGLMKYVNFSTGLVGACSGTDSNIATWLGRFAGTIFAPTAVYQDLVVTGGGNVGIGNISPLTKLTVNNAIAGAILPYIQGTGLSYNNEGISVAGSNTNNTNIGNGLTLYNNVASVGAYGPVIAWSSMTVNGAYNATYAFMTGVYGGAGGDNNWAIGDLIFGTGDAYGATERLRIRNNGNVGINITNPSYKLHVVGSTDIINATSTSTDARINIGHSGNGGYVGYANIGAGDAANTFYVTNGSGVIGSGITMNNAGNVGIRCTSPGVTLTISGTDALRLPTGTTAQRPTTSCSLLRFNSDLRMFDGAGADSWGPLGVAERIIMNNYNPYCTNAAALCIVDNADGGGTTWEFTNSGMFGVVNSSGGHSGQWGPLVYMTPGAWRWRWTAVPTICDGSIHPNTPAAAYKCTIQTSFNINGVSTGDIKYDTCIFKDNMHIGGLSTPTYITTAGCFTVSFSTNGYEGVRKIWFKELVLEKIR
jgi:hypothetical protein